jgi:uncharacterized protein (DUF1697 family)
MNPKKTAGRTSPVQPYFDSKLRTISTARNWNTVLKLLEMSQAQAGVKT